MGLFKRKSQVAEAIPMNELFGWKKVLAEVNVKPTHKRKQPVAGEYDHQPALIAAAGGVDEDYYPKHRDVLAVIGGKGSKMTVSVNGYTVGYIPPTYVSSVRKKMKELGVSEIRCHAEIWSRQRHDGKAPRALHIEPDLGWKTKDW